MKLIMRICILLALFVSTPGLSMSIPMAENDRMETKFQAGKLGEDATKAIDGIIYEGTKKLRDKGHYDEADQISSDWAYRFKDYLIDPQMSKDVGDHEFVTWLYATWFTLDSILGTQMMKMLHLDDLWEFAFTIPVVFRCVDNVDSAEYKKHFVMFAGATSFWVAMGVCASATIGTPYSVICSPVGVVCENVMEAFIAPRISNKVWERVCRQL